MERFSNSYQSVLDQVKLEFQSVERGEDGYFLVSYTEMPFFPGGQVNYSVIASKANEGLRCMLQEWDAEFDRNRAPVGIFNLDRLCMRLREVAFSASQTSEFWEIIGTITDLPATLDDRTVIVLDGVGYELMLDLPVGKAHYHWRHAARDIDIFMPLIEFLHRLRG